MERKAHRGRLWKIFGSEQFLRISLSKGDGEDMSGRLSTKVQGEWHHESLVKEVLDQVKRRAGTDCNWESFKEQCRKEGKLCEWTKERLQEAYDKVALEDVGRLCIAQDMLRRSTDFLRRIVAPVGEMGGVTLSYVCPHCSCFLLDDYTWWVPSGHRDGIKRKKKHYNWWLVCSIRRLIRMESAQQDTGGAHRRQHRQSESLQSARSAAGSV